MCHGQRTYEMEFLPDARREPVDHQSCCVSLGRTAAFTGRAQVHRLLQLLDLTRRHRLMSLSDEFGPSVLALGMPKQIEQSLSTLVASAPMSRYGADSHDR